MFSLESGWDGRVLLNGFGLDTSSCEAKNNFPVLFADESLLAGFPNAESLLAGLRSDAALQLDGFSDEIRRETANGLLLGVSSLGEVLLRK